MPEPDVSCLLTPIQVSFQFHIVICIDIFWIIMLVKFTAMEIPALRKLKKDRIIYEGLRKGMCIIYLP